MKEENLQKGAIPLSKIGRWLHRKVNRTKVGKGIGFDWNTGFDIRDTVGQITIENQGQSSSCGGQAGRYFLEIQRRLQKIAEGRCSAKSIYAPIAFAGGGTTVDMLEKQIGAGGCNLESDVPSYDVSGNPLPEYLMAEKSWITSPLMVDALTRAGYTPYDVPRDIDSVAGIIQSYGACLWEIEGQNNGTWLSAYPVAPSKLISSPIWNHFMCAVGAKMINGKKMIIALQSWGEGVGDKGVQYFSEDYFISGHIIDCFTFIHDDMITASANNTSMWSIVNRWFRKLWGLSV